MVQTKSLQTFLRLTKKGWSACKLYIWHWQSKILTSVIRQSSDITPTADWYSADNHRSTFPPSVGRYRLRCRPSLGRYLGWCIGNTLTDTSRSTYSVSTNIRLICRPTGGRYVDRYIGRVLVNMLTEMLIDISVEGCTKYTWSNNCFPCINYYSTS